MVENYRELIKNKLMEKIDCEAIILFGSYARGTQNQESDIDIAFLTEKEISKKDIFLLKQDLEDICSKDVDLINLKDDNIGDGFKYEILINGVNIYVKNEVEFDLYKIRVIRDYLELNESRQPIIDRIKEGGDIYGK